MTPRRLRNSSRDEDPRWRGGWLTPGWLSDPRVPSSFSAVSASGQYIDVSRGGWCICPWLVSLVRSELRNLHPGRFHWFHRHTQIIIPMNDFRQLMRLYAVGRQSQM